MEYVGEYVRVCMYGIASMNGPYSIIPLEYGGNDPHLRLSKSLSSDWTVLLIRWRASDIGGSLHCWRIGNYITSYFLREEIP